MLLDMFLDEKHKNALDSAVHNYRYKCGQWLDTAEAQKLTTAEQMHVRYDARDQALAAFEDCLAHIAVKANRGR